MTLENLTGVKQEYKSALDCKNAAQRAFYSSLWLSVPGAIITGLGGAAGLQAIIDQYINSAQPRDTPYSAMALPLLVLGTIVWKKAMRDADFYMESSKMLALKADDLKRKMDA